MLGFLAIILPCEVRFGGIILQFALHSEQLVEGVAQRHRLALEYITEHGSITNREYRTITSVSERTAARDLETLVEQGSLRAFGKLRSRTYKK